MKPVTLKDLSKYLLLSTSTVSRALSGDKNIRKETRDLVLDAAQKLGYKPNLIAKNLKLGRSFSIGVIVPEMITPFAAKVIEGIQQTAVLKGYRVMVAQSSEDPEIERKNLLMMKEFHVDGIIMSMCHKTHNIDLCVEFQESGIPIVLYDRIAPSLKVPKVIVNDYEGAKAIVEHLIENGRKNIVYLQAPDYIYNAIERLRGYQDALYKFDLKFDSKLLIKTKLTFEGGMKAVKKLLKRNIEFDAIFAFTDTMAIGAMNYLREQDISVPKDVAIAGFSGTELSTIVYPKLTTVEQPLHEMGVEAANLIIQQLERNLKTEKIVVFDTKLKIRDSTC